jgi:serine/threonine protein kinase
MDIIVANKYKINQEIGKGSFGKIYSAVNLVNGQDLAIKFEEAKTKNPQLYHEEKIYTLLAEDSSVADKGVPKTYFFGDHG